MAKKRQSSGNGGGHGCCGTLLILCIVLTLLGACAFGENEDNPVNTTSDTNYEQDADEKSTTGNTKEENVEQPGCFKNVNTAHIAWDNRGDVLIDQSKSDPEDEDPFIRVRSDENGIIRYINFYVRRNSYWSDEGISVDEAVSMISQYVDLDYLRKHYKFNSSYEIAGDYGTDSYFIIYDPDTSEQYGQFYISVTTISGRVYYVTAANDAILGDSNSLGNMGVDKIHTDNVHELVRWDKQLY